MFDPEVLELRLTHSFVPTTAVPSCPRHPLTPVPKPKPPSQVLRFIPPLKLVPDAWATTAALSPSFVLTNVTPVRVTTKLPVPVPRTGEMHTRSPAEMLSVLLVSVFCPDVLPA